jgi:hypothetical protein
MILSEADDIRRLPGVEDLPDNCAIPIVSLRPHWPCSQKYDEAGQRPSERKGGLHRESLLIFEGTLGTA